jgi:superfamily II DNA or RNA helicase
MSIELTELRESIRFLGPQFNEPMQVVGTPQVGDQFILVNLVGVESRIYRPGVTLARSDLLNLCILSDDVRWKGDPRLFKLGLEAIRIALAQEFDPFFGLSMCRVDPLPHQLDAVYNHLLKPARCRFLLADDAGAGKTIMAGLLLKELKLRRLVERVLVVCPANLAFQWQREMADRFQETFQVLRGANLRMQYGVNVWNQHPQVITSMDLAKREDMLPSLRQAEDWDLVIVDEAHRMSARDSEHKSERYRLGEILRDKSAHILLLTATPHKGDPVNFSLFLQLLDPDAFADVRSIRESIERGEAPCYLRRTKEAMLDFPKPQPDGTWKAAKLFTRRIPRTVAFDLEGAEKELYAAVTHYVQRQSARAAEAGDDRRARAVGFIMAMYQRRMASSTHSLIESLLRRQRALTSLLESATHLGELPEPDIPTPEEWEEMDDAERETRERDLERATLARRRPELEAELKDLAALLEQARMVEEGGHEIKLRRLKEQLTEQGIFADPNQRLLIFTEYKDTLDYLVSKLRQWNLTVGCIHGSMKPGSRDEEGTRLNAERNFWDLKIQVLVATEAAGEGINLQCCHVMFNYDIPWNPNRLEQRMGRIHRYGQKKDCLIFNFFARNTVEGRVLQKLLDKLQAIRDALDDDAVFNVVGEVMPSNEIERLLRDFYAGKLSETDIEARLEVDVREEDFRNICKSALEGLAKRSLNLPMLVERRAQAQERRIVPETVSRFFEGGAKELGLPLTPAHDLSRAFQVGRIPQAIRLAAQGRDWSLPPLDHSYHRICFEKTVQDRDARFEWITPGHPLFEAVRRAVWDVAHPHLRQGSVFYELNREQPSVVELYITAVADGTGHELNRRLFLIETCADGTRRLRDPHYMLDLLLPAQPPQVLPPVSLDDTKSRDFLYARASQPFLQEIIAERTHELDLIERSVKACFEELIQKRNEVLSRHLLAQDRGDAGATGLAELEAQKIQELQRRRDSRMDALARQRNFVISGVERIGLALVLPHPDRNTPDHARLKCDPETERRAIAAVIAHETARGCKLEDVQTDNLGFDLRSLNPLTGELRLIEVKGIGAATGTIFLTPNEKRVAEDRRDLYWLYVVTHCDTTSQLEEPIRDPARFPWHEVRKVEHYRLDVNSLQKPMTLREDEANYGKNS